MRKLGCLENFNKIWHNASSDNSNPWKLKLADPAMLRKKSFNANTRLAEMGLEAKVVVVDVDGTLLDSKGHLSNFSREVIKEYISKGGYFILATGKLFKTIYPLCREFPLRSKQIVANGALIVNPINQKIMTVSELDVFSIKSVTKILKKHKIEFVLYKPKSIYYQRGKVKAFNLNLIIQGGEDPPLNFESYESWNWKGVIKILSFITDPSQEKIIKEEIKASCPAVEVIRTTPYFLEFLKKGTSKLNALKIILKELEIGLKSVVAFGDQENDIELLREAGIGVAVANASSAVKNVADYVTASNDRDGVAVFIKKFILGRVSKH